MMARTYFTPQLFGFLRELAAHNTREWFLANKPRYESDVRDPLLAFIADFGPRLARISPHVVADPRPVGGSMFRIHRDTRFSRDKRPYKTVASAQFRHERGRDVHAPGFYLHLEPGNVFVGVGMWHPDGEALRLVREAIVEQADRWRTVVSGRAFRARFELAGESLQRPPRGFDAEHPLVEDLKRKDFVAFAPLTERDACQSDFLSQYAATARAAAPFMEFLTKAVGLAW